MDGSGVRLKTFLVNENISQKWLAEQIGVAPQYVNKICADRSNVSKKLADRLQELIGVNAGWLLTGNGEMYARTHETGPVVAHEPSEDIPRQSMSKGRPYYNVDFAAGFDIMVNDQTVTPDYLIDFRPYNDCDCWCNAHGNSMYPTIASGDIVAMKRIADFRYLINGEIYAIVTTNGLRTIKRIKDNGDTLTLIPDNKDVAEQVIPKSLLSAVYQIKGSLKQF